MDTRLDAAAGLAKELSDPTRLAALQALAVEGPHTMSQLAEALRVSAPRLGNHLGRLREAGLVAVEHSGRHAVYWIGDARVAAVLTVLLHYADRMTTAATSPPGMTEDRGAIARTCYDHTGGRLGVALFATLVDRNALRPPDGTSADLSLGPDPSAIVELGIDPSRLEPGRRKLATACLDRTHRLPHLGGELGRAVLERLLHSGLVARTEGGRTLTITDAGAEALPVLLPGFRP